MQRHSARPRIVRQRLIQAVAVAGLLAIVGMGIAGPSGILAWGQGQRMLDTRRAELARLQVQRDALKNRVGLLDPHRADPDLAGELVRSRLNVVHPDEMVMVLH